MYNMMVDGNYVVSNLSVACFYRCEDANLINMPIKVRKEDPRLYYVASFAQENISTFEEFTWDYGCSFEKLEVDVVNVVMPFHCKCGSTHYRDKVIDGPLLHHITNLLLSNDPTCGI